MPPYAWFPYDVLFVGALGLFLVGAFVPSEVPHVASVTAEYVAVVLLFLQLFWLFVACSERDASAALCAYAMDAYS